ncbi:MAG TPA: hypothetical protein VF543_11035 [Pyrinomonadaceae bacterium]|jgi:hypothetical protein
MRVKQIGLLLIILCLSSNVLAQDKPQFITKVEQVFREKEPAWKVQRINVINTNDPFQQSITFHLGKNQALVDISIWKREKDARDVFEGESIAFDNIMGKRKIKGSLPNLGDENYIWTNRGSTAWPTIKFRKGKINVTVFAPSVAIAKRFAQHIFGQMTNI